MSEDIDDDDDYEDESDDLSADLSDNYDDIETVPVQASFTGSAVARRRLEEIQEEKALYRLINGDFDDAS